jgi:hypothetical protein
MIIKGNLYLDESSIESLGNIKEIKGNLILWKCYNLKDLGNLEIIRGDLINLMFTKKLQSLGKLKRFDGKRILLYASNITPKYIEEEKPFLLDKCIFRIA